LIESEIKKVKNKLVLLSLSNVKRVNIDI